MHSLLSSFLAFVCLLGIFACTTESPQPGSIPDHFTSGIELAASQKEAAMGHARAHIINAVQQGNEREEIRGHQLIAYIEYSSKDYMASFAAMANAYSLAGEYGSDEFTVYQFTSMGIAAFLMGANEASAVYFTRAVKAYNNTPRAKDRNYAGRALLYQADLMGQDNPASEQLYQQSLELLSDAKLRATAYFRLARISIGRKAFDSALTLIQEGLKEEDSRDTRFMANYLTFRVEWFNGQIKSAQATAEHMLGSVSRYTPEQQFKYFACIGEFNISQGKNTLAVDSFLKAWDAGYSNPARMLELADDLLPHLNEHPRKQEVLAKRQAIEEKQTEDMKQVNSKSVAQVLHEKFFQAEQRALQARTNQASNRWFYISVALGLLLLASFFLHLYLKRLAIQKTIENENEAALEIIRDLSKRAGRTK